MIRIQYCNECAISECAVNAWLQIIIIMCHTVAAVVVVPLQHQQLHDCRAKSSLICLESNITFPIFFSHSFPPLQHPGLQTIRSQTTVMALKQGAMHELLSVRARSHLLCDLCTTCRVAKSQKNRATSRSQFHD